MRWLSLVLLLSARPTWATGDGEVSDDQALPLPTVTLEKGEPPRLAMAGLPAVAADGRIAFVASRSEYDESGRTELRIASPEGSMRPLPLDRTAAPQNSPDLRTIIFRDNVRRGRALLERGGFRALPEAQSCVPPDPADETKVPVPAACRCQPAPAPNALMTPVAVGPFLVVYDERSRVLRILDSGCQVVVRRKAEIGKHAHCCGGQASPDDRCAAVWDRMEVQGDGEAVLVTGVAGLHAPDGCELDRQYIAVWPAKRSARASHNWNPWERRQRKP